MLSRVAHMNGQTLSALVIAVDAERTPDRPLASALRVAALLAAGTGAAPDGADEQDLDG